MLKFDRDVGSFIEVDDALYNPYFQHKNGEAATIVKKYIETHDDSNSPVFSDREIFDILGMLNNKTGGMTDPKLIAIYFTYYGLALAEREAR